MNLGRGRKEEIKGVSNVITSENNSNKEKEQYGGSNRHKNHILKFHSIEYF